MLLDLETTVMVAGVFAMTVCSIITLVHTKIRQD